MIELRRRPAMEVPTFLLYQSTPGLTRPALPRMQRGDCNVSRMRCGVKRCKAVPDHCRRGEFENEMKRNGLRRPGTDRDARSQKLEVEPVSAAARRIALARVFGGQVIGQALVAACARSRTWWRAPRIRCTLISCSAATRKCRSSYEVDRIRDGKSFTTRRVVAIQHGQAIFTMAVSFHAAEPGFSHQFKDARRTAA